MDCKYQIDTKKKVLKRIVQFVLSVSVFCLFVWYSSGFFILPQCFNAYFSTCLFSMLTPTLERKYMFIICNAILALLSSSPPFHLQLQPQVSEEPLGDFLPIEEAKTQEDYSEQVSAAENDTDVLIIAEEEGGTGNSSEDQQANTDELNRKIEEFIRKMKEEMRIEAQRQPIEV